MLLLSASGFANWMSSSGQHHVILPMPSLYCNSCIYMWLMFVISSGKYPYMDGMGYLSLLEYYTPKRVVTFVSCMTAKRPPREHKGGLCHVWEHVVDSYSMCWDVPKNWPRISRWADGWTNPLTDTVFLDDNLVTHHPLLGGGLKHFLFTPLPGEMIQVH